MSVTHCWWVRHAPIEATGCYTGQSDVEAILPPPDTKLALELPEAALWFASPLKRAVQTAHWLMPFCNVAAETLRLAPELKEQSFGAWEGRNYYDVWQEAEHAHDWSQPETVRPEGGESFADLCLRVEMWLQGVLAEHAGRHIVIVAHAGTIRAALRQAQSLTLSQALALEMECGSVSHVTYAPEAQVHFINRAGWSAPPEAPPHSAAE